MKLAQLQEAKYDAPPRFRDGDIVTTPHSSPGQFVILNVTRDDEGDYWYTLENLETRETYEEPEWELELA